MEELGQKWRARIRELELEYEKEWRPEKNGLGVKSSRPLGQHGRRAMLYYLPVSRVFKETKHGSLKNHKKRK